MTCDKVLRQLPSLANLHARKNIAFIGPEGIGKTHLAQAYGNRCCTLGFKTYYLKATELKAKLEKAIAENRAESVVNFMVKPSCLIIGEIGRHHRRNRQAQVRRRVHEPVFRHRRSPLRERGPKHAHSHQQHADGPMGRLLHWRRRTAVRFGQVVRQGIGLHDEGPVLPREGMRGFLSRSDGVSH